jgi:DNA primase
VTEDRAALKDRIKEANDIVDVVGKYVALRQAGPISKGLCPFHDDHTPSFTVDPRRQTFRCWACNKYGDVFSFVQEINHIGFLEALEMLAQWAGISLENQRFAKHGPGRARMLEVVRWAAELFQQCLLDGPAAEPARVYLGERKLNGDIVRRFGLGFAPSQGDWLVQKAILAKQPLDLLEKVGLIAQREGGNGYYDRFRDRVMFPIRDMRGQTVGFGGRILPGSTNPAKYYNSSDTDLFKKSDQLYGIDQARNDAIKAGFLAVVEGYTDVLMAHQMGVTNVVATMGTALNDRHVRKLRHVVQKVVLLFDADAGGNTGVDRALEVFVRQNLDLKIAGLPDGLDPCDLLVQQGPEPLKQALANAVDVFEFKLGQVWKQAQGGIDAQNRAVEQMLGVLALTEELRSVKMELMVNRIAHRLYLKEETLWNRLRELHLARQKDSRPSSPETLRSGDGERGGASNSERGGVSPPVTHEPSVPAPFETDLLKILLAEPALVARASNELASSQIEHPGVRKMVEGLYRLLAEKLTPDLDSLRGRLEDRLLDRAMYYQQVGLDLADRPGCLEKVLERFRERAQVRQRKELKNQLQSAPDHAAARELLRKLRH